MADYLAQLNEMSSIGYSISLCCSIVGSQRVYQSVTLSAVETHCAIMLLQIRHGVCDEIYFWVRTLISLFMPYKWYLAATCEVGGCRACSLMQMEQAVELAWAAYLTVMVSDPEALCFTIPFQLHCFVYVVKHGFSDHRACHSNIHSYGRG